MKALDRVVVNNVWKTLDQEDGVVGIRTCQLIVVGVLCEWRNDHAVGSQHPKDYGA